MAEVIRIKRRLDLDPADAIILSSKRARLSEEASVEDATSFSKILKYAGTVTTQDDPVGDLLSKALKTSKSASKFTGARHKQRPIEFLKEKLRDDAKNWSKEMRYSLVSTQRGLNISQEKSSTEADDDLQAETKQLFKLYDVVNEDEIVKIPTVEVEVPVQGITCNGVPMTRHQVQEEGADSEAKFVYDLYYIEGKELDENLTQDQILSIAPIPIEEMYYRENEGSDDDSICEDEDDSNDENNWRNDYPEENSDFEKEMDYYGNYEDEEFIHRFVGCGIDGDQERDDDDDLISSKAFDKDVYNNGFAYAKFKATVLKPDCSNSDDDDDD